uniref:Uncharacterized protein n=1 Tax=Lepeophtheirus salmonis TaxID=72036 RepID=A0A0K2UYA7_LEPSM
MALIKIQACSSLSMMENNNSFSYVCCILHILVASTHEKAISSLQPVFFSKVQIFA